MQRAHFLGKYRILRRRENDRLARSRLLARYRFRKAVVEEKLQLFPVDIKRIPCLDVPFIQIVVRVPVAGDRCLCHPPAVPDLFRHVVGNRERLARKPSAPCKAIDHPRRLRGQRED